MKKVIAILLSIVLTLSLAACGGTTTTPSSNDNNHSTSAPSESNNPGTSQNFSGVFKVGVHIPMTGPESVQGMAGLNAIKLYAKLLNEKGGLLGKKVEVIAYDDQISPEVAVTVATKLIEVDNVDVAINGTGSSCCLATGELFNKAGIPAFGLGISKTFMAQGWEYQFRPTINTTISVSTLPKLMTSMGYKKLAMITGQNDYGINNRNVMLEYAPKAGMEIVADETMVSGDTDFSGQITNMLKNKPDAVFIGIASGDVATCIKQLRQFGWDGIIFYSENLQQTMVEIAGEASNYVAFAYPYALYNDINDIKDPQMKEFYELYLAEYGQLPPGDCAYRGWDAMLILEEAVKIAKSTERDAIRDAILEISGLKILGGTANFAATKNGECLTEYYNFIVIDGKNVNFADWLKTEDAQKYIKK